MLIVAHDSHEMSRLIYFEKKINMSSVVIVIGALRVKMTVHFKSTWGGDGK